MVNKPETAVVGIVREQIPALHYQFEPSKPSLRDLLIVLFHHSRLVVVVFLLSLTSTFVYVSTLPDVYESEAQFMITRDRLEPVVSSMSAIPNQQSAITLEELNSEIQLLRSRETLQALAAAHPPNETEAGDGSVGALIASIRSRMETSLTPEAELETRIRQLERRLSISRVRDSNTIRVTYSDENPQRAASVMQALTSAYLDKHLQVRRPARARDFFEQQTARYRKRFEESRRALESFNRRYGTIAADKDREAALNLASAFEAQLQRTLVDLRATEDRTASLERQLDATPERVTTEVRTSPRLLEEESAALLDLERKRTELEQKYQSDYPLIKQIEEQIAQSRRTVEVLKGAPTRSEATNANPTHQWLESQLLGARAESASLRAKVERLQEAISDARSGLGRLDRLALQQGDLLKDAASSEDDFSRSKRRQEEARISEALDSERILNVAVAEYPATPALPSGPQRGLLYGVGLVASLLCGFGSAIVRDYFRTTLYTPEEVERHLGIQVIASIPRS